jgi:phosphoribosylformylglycinamidine synthase
MLRFYKTGTADEARDEAKLRASLAAAGSKLASLVQERCFMVELKPGTALGADDEARLCWLIAETFEPDKTSGQSFLTPLPGATLLEIGPRLTYSTAWCSNALSICAACGLGHVDRIEVSRRYLFSASPAVAPADLSRHAAALHDRMTEQIYPTPLQSFVSVAVAAPTRTIPLMAEGRAALERVSAELGLGFDEADLEYYTMLFVSELKRDPTDVECFDMAQSNSEHSRHWFFGGTIIIDGVPQKQTLFQMVKATLNGPKVMNNSIIAFHDNSSAIRGFAVSPLRPGSATAPSAYACSHETSHLLLTAETHNFPSGVAPFPGAETGTGGRLRDTHATGRGSLVGAGISAYMVGNLRIPGFAQPWEDPTAPLPPNLAAPLDILIQASNGASDYGNKFGEPVVAGFARTFGLELPNGERREWLKPIMFSAGLGQIPAVQAEKGKPEVGMWVVKVGGPAYRIGVGGGAASSKAMGEGVDAAAAALDFDAVQRGDAEMENKLNRVIRACVELGEGNPIVSIHDQGAGGNGNVCKEIVDPLGAKLQVRTGTLLRYLSCVRGGEGSGRRRGTERSGGGNGNVCKEIVDPLGAKLRVRVGIDGVLGGVRRWRWDGWAREGYGGGSGEGAYGGWSGGRGDWQGATAMCGRR